jgi:hypothetical protein
MFTILSNGTGEYTIVILPDGQKMNSTYFIGCMLCPLTEICYPQGRGTHEWRFMLHFDNAPVQNTEGVQESLATFGFRRLDHRLYSPYLTACGFFFSVQ